MKIFIDIGHPAHVHYFRHFSRMMKRKGHDIFITARDKEVTFQLLDYYHLPYENRGKGKKGFWGKLIYLFQADVFLVRKALRVKPDLFLSFGSPYAAHAAWFLRKPHIAFDDTDHNPFEQFLYVPFTESIITPWVYKKDYGKQHVRFKGFMELCSLYPGRFHPTPAADLLAERKIQPGPYVILRFVSWDASHDMGLSGLSLKEKYQLVKTLSLHANVLISSETVLPDDLKPHAFPLHPARMHDLLAGAELLVSESLTMSAEAAFLGTPVICISPAKAGTLDEEVRLGLIELYRTSAGMLERALEVISDKGYKARFRKKTQDIVHNLCDVTALMVWLVEHYPASFHKLKEHPALLMNFIPASKKSEPQLTNV